MRCWLPKKKYNAESSRQWMSPWAANSIDVKCGSGHNRASAFRSSPYSSPIQDGYPVLNEPQHWKPTRSSPNAVRNDCIILHYIAFVQTTRNGGRGVSCHQVFHPAWNFLYRIATVKLGKMVRFNPLLCWGAPTQCQRLQFYRGPWRHRFYRDFMLNTALSTSQLRVLGTAILERDMFSLEVYQSIED